MAAAAAMYGLAHCRSCRSLRVLQVGMWPHGRRVGRRLVSVVPNAAELVQAKRAVRVVGDGSRRGRQCGVDKNVARIVRAVRGVAVM